MMPAIPIWLIVDNEDRAHCRECNRTFSIVWTSNGSQWSGNHTDICVNNNSPRSTWEQLLDKATAEAEPKPKPSDTPAHLGDWLEDALDEILEVMRERGRKYGAGNIAEWGELGVAVRLSDKMSRIKEMYRSESGDFLDESIDDTYLDIIGYSLIALGWRRGHWPGSEK